MSSAFVKESDEEWLHDVQPTLTALVHYLSRQNNGIRVYEVKAYMHPKKNIEIHQMSNGLEYAKDKSGVWEIV